MKHPKLCIIVALTFLLTASCTSITSELDPISNRTTTVFQTAATHYLLISEFDVARHILDLAIQFEPSNPQLYSLRGQANLGLYEWDRALADYEIAIQVDSGFAAAYFHRGVLYYSILQTGLETRDEALESFSQYLTMDPKGEFTELASNYIKSIEASADALNPCC